MSVNAAHDVMSIWLEISEWPIRERLALASRILQSLEREGESVELPQERTAGLRKLIGVWKTDNPPTDDEVEQLVEEERMKKFG